MSVRASRLWSELAGLTRRLGKLQPSDSALVPAEAQNVDRHPEWMPTGDPVRVVEEGHRKIIQHYQELLRTQKFTELELATIEERIAREEAALRQMNQREEADAA